jgi:hypothetical protein
LWPNTTPRKAIGRLDKVLLGPKVIAHAEALGTARHNQSVGKGHKGAHGGPSGGQASLDIHIAGAYGECAFALWRGVDLPTHVGVFSVPDFEPNIAIRTRRKDYYEVYRRRTEPKEWRYVLITLRRQRQTRAPIGILRGWIPGADMERDEWIQDYGGLEPAWFVPTKELHPMDAL